MSIAGWLNVAEEGNDDIFLLRNQFLRVSAVLFQKFLCLDFHHAIYGLCILLYNYIYIYILISNHNFSYAPRMEYLPLHIPYIQAIHVGKSSSQI